MAERLLTARELAQHLGVSPEWVLRRWQAGELPGYRLSERSHPVRFRLSEIERWLDTRHEGPNLKAVG